MPRYRGGGSQVSVLSVICDLPGLRRLSSFTMGGALLKLGAGGPDSPQEEHYVPGHLQYKVREI